MAPKQPLSAAATICNFVAAAFYIAGAATPFQVVDLGVTTSSLKSILQANADATSARILIPELQTATAFVLLGFILSALAGVSGVLQLLRKAPALGSDRVVLALSAVALASGIIVCAVMAASSPVTTVRTAGPGMGLIAAATGLSGAALVLCALHAHYSRKQKRGKLRDEDADASGVTKQTSPYARAMEQAQLEEGEEQPI